MRSLAVQHVSLSPKPLDHPASPLQPTFDPTSERSENGPKDICGQCQHNCCTRAVSGPPSLIGLHEGAEIESYMGVPRVDFLESPGSPYSAIKRGVDGKCYFFDPETRYCTIQATGGRKPFDCRAFPAHLLQSRDDPQALEWIIYKWCPLWSDYDVDQLRELEREVDALIAAGHLEEIRDFVDDVLMLEAADGFVRIAAELRLDQGSDALRHASAPSSGIRPPL